MWLFAEKIERRKVGLLRKNGSGRTRDRGVSKRLVESLWMLEVSHRRLTKGPNLTTAPTNRKTQGICTLEVAGSGAVPMGKGQFPI